MSRILITGGAGCLGSNLIERWLPNGHDILVIDNFATGKRDIFSDLSGLKIIEGTIADASLVDRCFEEFTPEIVIHSAAAYKDPSDWEEDAATNVNGTINVAKAAERLKVRRLVNFQTALCYGRPQRLPIPADHEHRPFTSYGISKTAGEQYLLMSNLDVVSFRLASVLAPRLAIGPIPTFYQRLKAGKECFCSATVRDFIDVSDFLDLIDMAITGEAPSGVFNASSGVGISIRQIFDVVAKYLQIVPEKEPPIVPSGPDDVPEVVLDSSRTEKAFGWRVKSTFNESVRKMLSWYDVNGVPSIHSHVRKPVISDGLSTAKQ